MTHTMDIITHTSESENTYTRGRHGIYKRTPWHIQEDAMAYTRGYINTQKDVYTKIL